MSDETYELHHSPQAYHQLETCVDPGDHHAPHRRFTGLVNFVCNCGYASGWVPRETQPFPADFIRAHLPPDYELSQGDLGHE